MAKKLTWETQTRKVSALVPNAKNPRTMSPQQMKSLKASLEKFDLVELPVVDTDNSVVAGHMRLAALIALGRGEEEIPVRVPSRKLMKSEYDQYLLSSNRISGEWDYGLLSQYFDIDTMIASGFDDDDVARVFADSLEVTNDDWDEEAELKKITKPKVQFGELYVLGSHRLICGNSIDASTLTRLMEGKQADTILQDPPFNIGLSYDKGVGGKKHYGGTVDDSLTDTAYKEFLKTALQNALAVTKKDAHIFTYCDQRYIWLLQTLYEELGIANKRVCLWIKNNASPTPRSAFNKQYEPCVYGTIGSPYLCDKVLNLSEVLNKEVGTGNRTHEDIYDMIDIWLAKRLNGTSYSHPTEKSPVLHERALRRCTKPGDIVLDCFGGSGSLLIACEQLKRSAYLVEREPIFVELTIRRWEKMTGLKANRL